MCPECRALYDGWLRWLTDQGPVTGWRNYPPANGNERRIERDIGYRNQRINERMDLVKSQLALVVRSCLAKHQQVDEKAVA